MVTNLAKYKFGFLVSSFFICLLVGFRLLVSNDEHEQGSQRCEP